MNIISDDLGIRCQGSKYAISFSLSDSNML